MKANRTDNYLKTAIILGIVFMLSACANQQVSLVYNAIGPSMGTASTMPAVMVEQFQSSVSQEAIGADSDGAAYSADKAPAVWVTEALTDELVRLGVRASYSPYASSSNCIIKGSLDQLWLEQTGMGQYKVNIRLSVQLPPDAAGTSVRKSYTAEQSSVFMPTDANFSELIESTLRDAVVSAAQDIKKYLQQL